MIKMIKKVLVIHDELLIKDLLEKFDYDQNLDVSFLNEYKKISDFDLKQIGNLIVKFYSYDKKTNKLKFIEFKGLGGKIRQNNRWHIEKRFYRGEK